MLQTCSHADRDEIRRRAAADFPRLFKDLGGEFRGQRPLCPFHVDTTPSASIQRGWFHCFVCNLNLDPIAFYARMQRTDFLGALHALGDRYGVTIQQVKRSPAERAQWIKEKRRRDRDLPIALLWRRSAAKMVEDLLTDLKQDLFGLRAADPGEIQFLEQYLQRLHNPRAADLVEEYRWWLQNHSKLTAAMVRAAWHRQQLEERVLWRLMGVVE